MPFPDPGTLAVFAAAAIALLVVPGRRCSTSSRSRSSTGAAPASSPCSAYRWARWCTSPRRRWGLSALLLQSATAFNIVKFAGAAYLVFRPAEAAQPGAVRDDGERPPRRLDKLFAQGIVVNVLNRRRRFFAFLLSSST